MPLAYQDKELLYQDRFVDLSRWYHEGGGSLDTLQDGGMRLHCLGSRQGGAGCMAFFRPGLPDQVSVAYDIIVYSHGGLVINYLAARGLHNEDLIEDRNKLAPRTGEMKNYYARKWGLQSYHVSYSRFDDQGHHTNTSNWRRNPGCLLVGHGNDLVQELGRKYRIRITKDSGYLQLYVDGVFAHGVVDRDTSRYPIPDVGKFGFRLIGSDVKADVFDFNVHRISTHPEPRRNAEDQT